MKAIFNRSCVLVGWYEPKDKNVFSKEMRWIGFVHNGYFFAKSVRWLGALVNGTFVDKKGKPVGWIEGYTPVGVNPLIQPMVPMKPLQPLTPLRPLNPILPLRPLVPLGGVVSIGME